MNSYRDDTKGNKNLLKPPAQENEMVYTIENLYNELLILLTSGEYILKVLEKT